MRLSSKYGNRKIQKDGYVFDSKKEAARYFELKYLQSAEEIRHLELQPKFLLQEGFVDIVGIKYRPIYYIADFSYEDKKYDWQRIVEDVKGVKTEVYKLKKKLFLKKYNYIFIES